MQTGRRNSSTMKRNIIVLGDTGAGKSSLINMLIGKNVAATSNRATGCTFHAEPYEDDYGNRIFDTVGLNEPSKGKVPANEARRCLSELLNSLKSGVNLIVFVVRKGRITETTTNNYYMFVRRICQGKVPVLLAISGCESDLDESEWYNSNKSEFARHGMKFDAVVSGCFMKFDSGYVSRSELHAEIMESYNKTKENILAVVYSPRYDYMISFGSFRDWLNRVMSDIWEEFAQVYTIQEKNENVVNIGEDPDAPIIPVWLFITSLWSTVTFIPCAVGRVMYEVGSSFWEAITTSQNIPRP